MFGGSGATAQLVALTLYTDAFIIRGSIETRQRRITDILNGSDEPFLILSDVTTDEFGPSGHTVRAEYAQINLSSTLFAVAHTVIQAIPELRTVKSPLPALISIPPFKISGQIHLLPRDGLRAGLGDLVGRFLPVTDATYWSDSLGEARTGAAIVAVNHARAQILAPHREADPWAGMPPADSVPRELPPDSGW